MTRILLADDHAVVRNGLKETLEEIPGVVVRAEASTVDEMLQRLARNHIDLVVMDLSMPGRNGLEALTEIKRRWKHIAVFIYTMHTEPELAVRAYKLGASGYLAKEAPLSEFVTAIKKIVAGGKYVPGFVTEKLANHVGDRKKQPLHWGLSEREVQVMRSIAEGKALKEIAHDLSVSAKTVSTYRSRLLEKMHLRTNADLTRYVVEHRVSM